MGRGEGKIATGRFRSNMAAGFKREVYAAIMVDFSQSSIFPFDRREQTQTATIFVFKQRARTGESDITTEWVGGV